MGTQADDVEIRFVKAFQVRHALRAENRQKPVQLFRIPRVEGRGVGEKGHPREHLHATGQCKPTLR